MNTIFKLILALCFFQSALQVQAAEKKQAYITMHLPQSVIADTIQPLLPLTLNGSSSKLEGTLTIQSITHLIIKKQQILCHLDLRGNDLSLITTVANQEIRLKLGTAQVDFDCDARIRFDPSKQILFIRLFTQDVQTSGALQKGDIGQTIALLLNGREFPLALQNIAPIIAEASNKMITIETKIINVRAVEGALQIILLPSVKTTPLTGAGRANIYNFSS